jgi:hypothetical protein
MGVIAGTVFVVGNEMKAGERYIASRCYRRLEYETRG